MPNQSSSTTIHAHISSGSHRTNQDDNIRYLEWEWHTPSHIGDTYLILSKLENGLNNRTNARTAYEAALTIFSKSGFTRLCQSIQSKIKKAKNS